MADLTDQGNEWLNTEHIKRMTEYSAFDKFLWFSLRTVYPKVGSQWDKDNKIDEIIDEYLKHIEDVIHWDHISGHKYFSDFYAHADELDIQPEILIRMREAFRNLKMDGKPHHGSKTFQYGDRGVWL